MSHPPDPRDSGIPWRDILAFPLSGLSLRLFFLILGLILLLTWQLVLHAGNLIEHNTQNTLAAVGRLLVHDIETTCIRDGQLQPATLKNRLATLTPATIAITLHNTDGDTLYHSHPGRAADQPQTHTQPIHANGKPIARLTLRNADNTALTTLRNTALLISLIALILLAALAWWLARALRRISRYAEAMAAGQPAQSPEYTDIYLKRLAQSVTTLRRELNGKAQIEQYAHNLTHELKTPLTAIHAAAEILREPLSEPERQRFLTQIERHSAQMHTLINRLLELARLDNRDTLDTRAPIDLAALCAHITHSHQTLLDNKNLRYQLDLQPATIHGDPLLIRQAIQNLLGNAIDFARPATPIHISLTPQRLTIRNHGAPIPDYALPRLFERHYSLPRPDTGQKSSGLGLPFVQRIMSLHGGSVHIANHADGVEATLHFPVFKQKT